MTEISWIHDQLDKYSDRGLKLCISEFQCGSVKNN